MVLCSFTAMVIILKVIFMDQDFMNHIFEVEKVLLREIANENRNIFMPMGYRLEMSKDYIESSNSLESFVLKIKKNKD